MPLQCGTIIYHVTLMIWSLSSGEQPVFCIMTTTDIHCRIHVAECLRTLRSSGMLTTVDVVLHTQQTGRNTTRSPQAEHNLLPEDTKLITCKSDVIPVCTGRHFSPSAVQLWNRFTPNVCYLPPDSFKSELSEINLI